MHLAYVAVFFVSGTLPVFIPSGILPGDVRQLRCVPGAVIFSIG